MFRKKGTDFAKKISVKTMRKKKSVFNYWLREFTMSMSVRKHLDCTFENCAVKAAAFDTRNSRNIFTAASFAGHLTADPTDAQFPIDLYP